MSRSDFITGEVTRIQSLTNYFLALRVLNLLGLLQMIVAVLVFEFYQSSDLLKKASLISCLHELTKAVY